MLIVSFTQCFCLQLATHVGEILVRMGVLANALEILIIAHALSVVCIAKVSFYIVNHLEELYIVYLQINVILISEHLGHATVFVRQRTNVTSLNKDATLS